MKKTLSFLGFALLILSPLDLWATEVGVHALTHPDYSSILWVIPFIGILLSIAFLPLMVPKFWHNHFGKISAFWCLGFLVPCLMAYGVNVTIYTIFHMLLLEYIPFIILLFSLFTITGGLQIIGGFRGTPSSNTLLLTAGTLLASLIGTTGASMLFIHSIIHANRWRHRKTHIIIFFIFLVSNIGGVLTPLGDPPLFLGFLYDVPFFWPAENLLIPLLIVGIPLIGIFYAMDSWFFNKELSAPPQRAASQKFRLNGSINILFLGGVIGGVLISGLWHPGIEFKIAGIPLKIENCLRDVLLLMFSGLSLWLSPKDARHGNHFNWAPITEVAKIFIAIFLTVSPILIMLGAGAQGPFKGLLDLTSTNGIPDNAMYFWLTGILSSFLDNAPTYLVFFYMAGGDASVLTCVSYKTLIAISSGAVFMGAMTYIGNAPNFMVRSIAEQENIKMPSFFGYMAWSVPILGIIFLILTLIYFI